MNNNRRAAFLSATSAIVLLSTIYVEAFTIPSQREHQISPLSSSPLPSAFKQRPIFSTSSPSTSTLLFESSSSGYFPPEQSPAIQTKSKVPQPKVGDVVRYYDLDGGRADGQELVGKITFIQSTSSPSSSSSDGSSDTATAKKWLAEVTEMEDVGDGYYTEYPSRKRRKSKLLSISSLSPLVASYVRTEDAYKIPTDANGRPMPSYESYDLENYAGPASAVVNTEVVEEDLRLYTDLKWELIKGASIAGLIGTVVANLVVGLDDALIYAAGAVAGVGYLFFLGVKTDTVGSPDAKLGSNVSNLRFALPLLVLVGVSFQNLSKGGSLDTFSMGAFRTVTPDQFASAMLGFLTYRIPLFASQLGPLLGESAGMMLPGSAGMAMQMANEAKSGAAGSKASAFGKEDLTTVLLISGPAGTGKSELVEKLIEESGGKLVPPKRVDIVAEPILYEQLVARGEILQVDESGRYALTTDGILSAARKPGDDEDDVGQVVVVDADVKLCKKLVNLGGTRLVGVWIGLDELEKFESNLKDKLDSGAIPIPEDETKDSVLRAKIREIVKDIEYGVVSGIFEFTVLNDDFDKSLLQLKNAADYCFE